MHMKETRRSSSTCLKQSVPETNQWWKAIYRVTTFTSVPIWQRKQPYASCPTYWAKGTLLHSLSSTCKQIWGANSQNKRKSSSSRGRKLEPCRLSRRPWLSISPSDSRNCSGPESRTTSLNISFPTAQSKSSRMSSNMRILMKIKIGNLWLI